MKSESVSESVSMFRAHSLGLFQDPSFKHQCQADHSKRPSGYR